MPNKVVLHFYDLGSLLEKKPGQLIMTSSVQVFDREFYYNQAGICCDMQGLTPFGKPFRSIEYGAIE